MKYRFIANIKWITDGSGRRSVPVEGTAYSPIIRLDDNPSEAWSILFTCPDDSGTDQISFAFLSSDAPVDRIKTQQWYGLYEGPKKVAEVFVKYRYGEMENMMDRINDFLEVEIFSQEFYDEIMFFVNCYELRTGEFEGNEYVICKNDRDNFLIYPEYELKDGSITQGEAFSIGKDELIARINEYAKTKDDIQVKTWSNK